jgi:ATP-dependent Lon protease
MGLLETVSKINEPGHEVFIHVMKNEDEFSADKQADNFQKMSEACSGIGIAFTWEFDESGKKHDRDITTDTGWKIVLSRGLDVFQRYELNEAFSFSNRLQQQRHCKEFNVTYVRVKKIEFC